MKTQEKMVELFKIEELQERLEFGEWSQSSGCSDPGTCGTEVTFGWGE